MTIHVNEFVVAVRSEDTWGLLKAAAPKETGHVLAVRYGPSWALARAIEPKAGDYGLLLRGGEETPLVMRLWKPKKKEEEEEPDPYWPPEPDPGCGTVHPLCFRMPCRVWLKRRYFVTFTGFEGAAARLNGVTVAVFWDGQCLYAGTGGGLYVELDAPDPYGAYRWFLYAFDETLEVFLACPSSGSFAPEENFVWRVNYLSAGELPAGGAGVVITA